MLSGAAGEYMETASVVEWRAALGAHVAAGETVVVVETAKAATEIAAPVSGRLAGIAAPVGSEVAIGACLGTILPDAPRAEAAPALRAEGDAIAAPSAPQPPASGMPRRWQAAFASPLAKRTARAHGIDLALLTGSGPAGRICRADVLVAHAGRRDPSGVFALAVACDGRALLESRARLWEQGIAVPLRALVIAGLLRTLSRFPQFQAAKRLVLTVLAEQGGASVIIPRAAEPGIAALAEVASPRPGVCAPLDIAGSLSVLDASAFGLFEVTPPLPAGAIAAVGIGAFYEVPALPDRQIENRPLFRLSLTAHTALIDTETGARFLAALREGLEQETAFAGGARP